MSAGPGCPGASASAWRSHGPCSPTFPFSILDEPGEHLDTATADGILADLLVLTRDRATLLITHRLAGLADMDEVLVLDSGRVVERGTHAELLALGGRYASLWQQENG